MFSGTTRYRECVGRGRGAGAGGVGGNDEGGGSAGLKGVVIIRSPQAAASTTGSPTVTTVGSDTVYTFTDNGSITF